MKTMIDQAYILTMNAKMDVFEDGYLIFEDDTIIEVGQIRPLVLRAGSFMASIACYCRGLSMDIAIWG